MFNICLIIFLLYALAYIIKKLVKPAKIVTVTKVRRKWLYKKIS